MAIKLTKAVYMFLGQGGRKAEDDEVDPERGFIVFVASRSLNGAKKEAQRALQDKGWLDVALLQGGEVPERPEREPHGDAWMAARQGSRAVITYEARDLSEHANVKDRPG